MANKNISSVKGQAPVNVRKKKCNTPKKQHALPKAVNDGKMSLVHGSILDRNKFYSDGRKNLSRAVLLLSCSIAVLAICTIYAIVKPPKVSYFATTEDWRLKELTPLSQPILSEPVIIDWVSGTIRRLFSLSFKNWREELQAESESFTDEGWTSTMKAIADYGITNTLEKSYGVSTASLKGQPIKIRDGRDQLGRYYLILQVPISIIYTSSSTRTTHDMTLDVRVVRVSEEIRARGVAIDGVIGQ